MPFTKPRLLGPKPWGTELLFAETPHYTGKVLRMEAGEQGPLQYHVQKDEAFYLFEGSAVLTLDRDGITTVDVPMRQGQAFHVPPGTVHRVKALTYCVFFEVSTPHFDDRVNVEDRYRDSGVAPL